MFCLSSPSATFALQRGDFVPREWLAAKSLLSVSEHNIHSFQLDVIRTWQFLCGINSVLEIIVNYHGQLYPLVAWATGASGELGEERSETEERVKGRKHQPPPLFLSPFSFFQISSPLTFEEGLIPEL